MGGSLPPSLVSKIIRPLQRCEYVPVRSLSNVLFSRVPEGQNTDTLRDEIPMPRVITPPDRPGRGSLESSKERRDRVGPSRTVFGQGWPNAEPCMFNADEQLRLFTSYRGGRLSLEAVLTDLVCRVAPRLITNLEEYQEAGLAGLRIARSRQYQVRGRGTGGYCGIDVDARGRV